MPGIDYQTLRSQISMRRVLALIDDAPLRTQADQWRGRCPISTCRSDSRRCFSVHLTKHVYRCFGCGAQGQALELWGAVTALPLHEAAHHLCQQLGIPVPIKSPFRNSKTKPHFTTHPATTGKP